MAVESTSGEPLDLASSASVFGSLARKPQSAALAGALFLSFSGILARVSGVSPATASAFRALYALPFLVAVALIERRRLGPRSWSQRFWGYLAGVFLAIDLVAFHYGIRFIGAGLATVMGNIQVIFVGAIAWLLLAERPSRALLTGLPIALAGVVLISGVVGSGSFGTNPVLGVVAGLIAASTYAGYLLLIRKGRDRTRVAGPILDASIGCVVASAVLGIVLGEFDPVPNWPSHGWLVVLALMCQFAGGLLVAVALPRLPAVHTSLILLAQPVCAVLFAMALLGERPSSVQLAGVVLVLAGVAVGTVPFRHLLTRRRVAAG